MCVLGLGCATKKNDHTPHHPSGFWSYLGYTGTTRTWRSRWWYRQEKILKPETSRSPKVRSPLFATSCSGWYSVPPARRRCRRPTRRARRPSRSRSRSRASRATTTTRASSSLRSEYLPEARRSTTSSCTDGGYIVVVKTPHPYASRRLDRRRSSNPLASTSHAAARWDAPRAP